MMNWMVVAYGMDMDLLLWLPVWVMNRVTNRIIVVCVIYIGRNSFFTNSNVFAGAIG